MQSYKIYLTKSSEVAARISQSFHCGGSMPEDIKCISQGLCTGSELIPAIYHNKGYFYCVAELKEHGGHNTPTYELTVC